MKLTSRAALPVCWITLSILGYARADDAADKGANGEQTRPRFSARERTKSAHARPTCQGMAAFCAC
jgi:hypothetical protein